MNGEGVSRRWLLKAGGAAAVSALDPASALAKSISSDGGSEAVYSKDFVNLIDRKFDHVRQALEAFQARLRYPAVRTLHKDPKNAARAVQEVVAEHPGCHFEMLSEKTKGEVREFFARSTVWLSRLHGETAVQVKGTKHLTGVALADAINRSERAGAGQGVVIRRAGEHFVVTNAHVVQLNDSRPEYQERATRLDKGPTDIAFYRVTPKELQSAGVELKDVIDIMEPLPKEFELHGAPVFCRGFDPDKYPGKPAFNPQGFKEWFGVASSVSAALWEGIRWGIRDGEKAVGDYDHLSKAGYTFPTPEGEAKWREDLWVEINGQKVPGMPAQKTSGSGVVAFAGGKLRLVGIMFCAFPVAAKKTDLSRAGFHALPHIVAAINDGERIFDFSTPGISKPPQYMQSRP